MHKRKTNACGKLPLWWSRSEGMCWLQAHPCETWYPLSLFRLSLSLFLSLSPLVLQYRTTNKHLISISNCLDQFKVEVHAKQGQGRETAHQLWLSKQYDKLPIEFAANTMCSNIITQLLLSLQRNIQQPCGQTPSCNPPKCTGMVWLFHGRPWCAARDCIAIYGQEKIQLQTIFITECVVCVTRCQSRFTLASHNAHFKFVNSICM